MSRKTAIHRVTAMRTYKFRGLCLDMSIQLQAVIIGRGWNERKMKADKKEGDEDQEEWAATGGISG